jgi:hypothetical protein
MLLLCSFYLEKEWWSSTWTSIRVGPSASRGGDGGWLGWSWIRVILRVAEMLNGVQLQEVLSVFWNPNRAYRFPEHGMRVDGNGNGPEAKASNRNGNGIWVDLGAAKIFEDRI